VIYLDHPNTFVCSASYNTVMNCVSNMPDLALYWLQQQNITKKITKLPPHTVKKPCVVVETEHPEPEPEYVQEAVMQTPDLTVSVLAKSETEDLAIMNI
jgi:hypothetical protein